MDKVLSLLFLIIVSSMSFGAPPQQIQTRPNVFKGQTFYQNGRPIGYSRPNIYGQYNYYMNNQYVPPVNWAQYYQSRYGR